jgi:phenylpropionate dioxygenase-like ring-hydroxylating dioxygenase large terminal subunit
MAAWCFITVLARMMVCGVMLCFRHVVLEELSAYVALHWSCNPTGLLVLVMVVCPVGMNIGQLWVQDQFLQGKEQEVDSERQARASVAQHIASEPIDQDLRLSITQQLARLSTADMLEGSAQDLKRQMQQGPSRPKVKEYQKLQK